ncbi:MAG: amino acid permease [Alphaproteobacteria bacterium]|nr:MAG: amino acid permease [Alphaproteobacteria bacterium]
MTAQDGTVRLRRRIGFWLLTLYGVGVMIGAGIYVLVGAVAGAAGMDAPWAFLLAGLVAAPTAISYAELSSRIPESAGEAAYVAAATGLRAPAIAVGMLIAAVGVVSSAAILQGGVGYLRAILPLDATLLTVVLLGALTLTAVLGVLESLAMAALFTLIEVAGLLLVAAAGFWAEPMPDFDPLVLPTGAALGGMLGAILLAFFAFIGFEDMVNMAEETRNPRRVMPRAILAALALTSAIYMLVSLAAVRSVPIEALAGSSRPLALVIDAAWPGLVWLLSGIAVFAALNGILAQIVMASRVLYGLGARHGGVAAFARLHPRFGTPVIATLFVAALVLVLTLTLPLAALAEVTSSILLVVFVGMNLALIALRRRGEAPPDAFRAPGWMPWLGAGLSALTLLASQG